MKTFLLLFLFVTLSITGFSQGLENIIVEKYYVSNAADSAGSVGILPVGSVTYRIFVDMAPGYKFLSAYGNANHPLSFATTTNFFNNEDRGDKTPTYTKNQAKLNTVMLDSWISVGASCSGNFGILKSEDTVFGNIVNSDGILQNNDTMAGIPLYQKDGLMLGSPKTITQVGITTELDILDNVSQAGNLVSISNGAWASLTGSKGPTPTNRILIAQFTTKGVFLFHINVQVKDTLTNIGEKYVYSNPVADEQTFTGLNYSSNLAPAVSITDPLNGASFVSGTSIPVHAQASDFDGTVKKVCFYVDNNILGSDTTFPFEVNYTGVYGNHTLHCFAIDDMNDTTFSDTLLIHVGAVGTHELQPTSANVKIYPNPASTHLYLEIFPGESTSDYTVNISDIQGRLVMNLSRQNANGLTQKVIDISSLRPGQYLLECAIGTRSFTQKFSKQ